MLLDRLRETKMGRGCRCRCCDGRDVCNFSSVERRYDKDTTWAKGCVTSSRTSSDPAQLLNHPGCRASRRCREGTVKHSKPRRGKGRSHRKSASNPLLLVGHDSSTIPIFFTPAHGEGIAKEWLSVARDRSEKPKTDGPALLLLLLLLVLLSLADPSTESGRQATPAAEPCEELRRRVEEWFCPARWRALSESCEEDIGPAVATTMARWMSFRSSRLSTVRVRLSHRRRVPKRNACAVSGVRA